MLIFFKTICFISLLIIFLNCSRNDFLYTKSEIINDINYLINDIENIHPEPYAPYDKEAFLEKLSNIIDKIPEKLTKIDAWKVFTEILALKNDGHCFFIPPFKEIGDFNKFPFSIKIDRNSNTFIVSNSKDETYNKYQGKKILSINGLKTDSLIKFFKKHTSADNDAFFYFMIEENIDYSLFLKFGSPEYFNVEFVSNNDTILVKCNSVKKINYSNIPDYSYILLNDSIGYIKIATMKTFEDFDEFKEFFKSSFDDIKASNISNLIIDFRGNKGGDSQVGDELIKYLSPVSFSQYEKAIAKISPITSKVFNYKYEKDTLLEKVLYNNLTQPYNESMRYSGNTYVIIDGGTFSSAGSTAWCIKHYNLATVIGSESGGLGVHYGYPINRTLPNTKLSYLISHIKWYHIGANDNSTHGLIPDYEIELEVEDIKQNIDTEIEFVIKLINSL